MLNRFKGLIIFIVVIVLSIILFFVVKSFTSTDDVKPIYGSRLNSIKDINVTDKQITDIKNLYKESSIKQSVKVVGKTINIFLTVQPEMSLDVAKGLASKSLEVLDDKQKSNYDIQIFISKDVDAKDFPIIGYKQRSAEEFKFTKDRTAE